jgi:MFS family permease
VSDGLETIEAESSAPMVGTGAPVGAAAAHSRLGVLRHRHFRNVWLGAMGSNIGGWMEGVGVQWIVAEKTGSTLVMAYLAAAQLGPTLVLGVLGGLTADRVNRKQLLLVTQAMMMVIAASLAVVSYSGYATPPVLIGLSLLQGITMAFNIPAWQVLTPRLVPREELAEAIALNGLQFNLSRIVGPALAGPIMASSAQGATALFAINTLSFLGVLIAIASTPDAPAPPREETSVWVRTREAFGFVFHSRGPRAAFLAMVVFAMLAAPLMRMLPLFVSEVYHRDEVVFSWLLAVIGAGAVVGVLVLKKIPKWYPKHHFIPLSITSCGVTIVLFSASTSVPVASVILFFAGAFWLWSFNSAFAAMQLLVEDRMRGRVMSVCNMAVFGAMPLGALIAGLIGEIVAGRSGSGVATQVGVGVMGAVLVLAGFVMLSFRTPEVDGLKPGDPGYERRPGLLRGVTARAHRP